MEMRPFRAYGLKWRVRHTSTTLETGQKSEGLRQKRIKDPKV